MKTGTLSISIAAAVLNVSLLVNPSSARTLDSACNLYSDARDKDYLSTVRDRISHNLPARYSNSVYSIEIKEVDDPDTTGPQLHLTQRPFITIPKDYLRDQCLMVVIQDVFARRPFVYSKFRKQMDECSAASGSAVQCFRKVTANFDDGVTKEPTKDELVFYRSFILDAADFLIAHEIGHIILRNSNDRRSMFDLDEEFEADLFAQIVSMSERPVHQGVLMGLATSSLIDDYRTTPPTHDSGGCRSARTLTFLKLTAAPMMTVMLGRMGIAMVLEADGDLGKSLEKALAPQVKTGRSYAVCNVQPTRAVKQFTADIDYIVSELVKMEPLKGEQAIPNISRLIDRKYATPFGRMLGLSCALSLFLALDDSKYIVSAIGWPKVTGKEGQPYLALSQKVWNLADGGPNSQDIRSPELSSLILIRALVDLANGPKGSDAVANFRKYVVRFDRAAQFDERMSGLWEGRIGIAGSNGISSPSFNADLYVNAYMTYISGQVLLGNCAAAAKYAAILSSYWKEDIQIIKRLNEPKICALFTDKTIEYTRSLGWNYTASE